MGRQQTRHRPGIHARRITDEEFRICNGDTCRNAIALWLKTTTCSRCRGRRRKR